MPARLYMFDLSHPSQIALRMKGLAFPQVARFVEGRPCAAHARRVLPDAPEPVPLVLPEAWLPAATGG